MFADEAENRIDQDLMQLEAAERSRPLLRRYQKYLQALQYDFMNVYKERIERVRHMHRGKETYVPGEEIDGDALRTFPQEPIISAPLVCQLCDARFVTESTFARHKKHEHRGESEYRKRVLYLQVLSTLRVSVAAFSPSAGVC